MTIDEIRERDAEIKDRLTAITAELDGELTDEEIDARKAEVGSLQGELQEHRKEELKLMTSVTKTEPVIKEETKKERKNIMTKRKVKVQDTMEYREAFRDYLMHGDVEYFRAGDATVTTDVPDVIVPTTILTKLIKLDPTVGSIYEQVTRTNYPSGIVLPIGEINPELKWLAERKVADNTDASTTSITFTGFKAQIKVAISFETDVMAVPEFETLIAQKINEAILHGFDEAIIAGDGMGQPKGILQYETSDNVYSVTDLDSFAEYQKAYNMIPMQYQDSVALVINNVDAFAHLLTINGTNGLAYTVDNTDANGLRTRRFMGVPIILVQNAGLPTASQGGIFGFFCNLKDYYFNINRNTTIRAYIDEDTDDIVTKATLMADGKLVDTDSLVFLKVGVTTSKKSA